MLDLLEGLTRIATHRSMRPNLSSDFHDVNMRSFRRRESVKNLGVPKVLQENRDVSNKDTL